MKSFYDRLPWVLVNYLLIIIPFFFVSILPIVDLPQHIDQVRLLFEVLHHNTNEYVIVWNTPYSLIYLIMIPFYLIFSPLVAAKATIALIALFWVLTIHVISAVRGNSLFATILASLLFFNVAFYWGLLQFITGVPLLLLWFLLVDKNRNNRRLPLTQMPLFFLMSILLYFSHVLIFITALLWFAFVILRSKPDLRYIWTRVITLIPAFVVLLIWYPSFRASGFDSETKYGQLPTERLNLGYLVDNTFGGFKGPLELIFLLLIIAWITVGIIQSRKSSIKPFDKELVFFGIFCGILALSLPNLYTHSLLFSNRWLFVMFTAFLLASPKMELKSKIITSPAVAILFAALFTITTGFNWSIFERDNLKTLTAAIDTLPRNQKVISLNFLSTDERYKPPFIHAGIYAAIQKNASLNFSFTQFGTALVQNKDRRFAKWTPGLEWFPFKVTNNDFKYFDYALINGTKDLHKMVQKKFPLIPVTNATGWNLYLIEDN